MKSLFKEFGWIKYFPGKLQAKIEIYHDAYQRCLRVNEEYYHKVEKPKVRQMIKEFKEENKEFEKECKIRAMKNLKDEFDEKKEVLENMFKQNETIAKKEILLNELLRLDNIINRTITDSMIQQAEEYPIENILEINSAGFALCINHDDRKPSMYCKNNYAHCFSCGWTGNTIKILMKKENLNFKEAVIRLQ